MVNKIRNVFIVILALLLVGLAVGLIIKSRDVSDDPVIEEPFALKTPELSVIVTDVKTDEVTVAVSYGNIDGNADTAVLYGYVYGTKAYEKALDGESGEFSIELLIESPWTFYIEVSDSAGKYLSAVSEQVEIEVGFLFEEVTETLTYSDVVPQSDSDDTAYTDYYVRVEDGQYITGGVYLPAGYYRLYGHYLSGVYTFWILLRNGVNGTDYVLDDTTADTSSVWGYNVIYQVSTDDVFAIGLYTINPNAVAAS